MRPICCSTALLWCSPKGGPPRTRCSSARRPPSRVPRSRHEELLRWGWLATVAGVYVWDYDTCLAVAIRGVQLARDIGALEVLAVAANVLAQAAAMGGDFATAAELVAEADAVTEATGTRTGPYGALVLSAFRGRESEVSKLVAATVAGRRRRWPGNHHPVHALRQGGGHERPRPLRRGAGGGHRGERRHARALRLRWALSELIEAASRTSQDRARQARPRATGRAHAGQRLRLGARHRGASHAHW